MKVFGIVNIIRTGGAVTTGGGWFGPLLGLVAVLVGGVWLYRALEGALLGVRDSTAAANTIVAWCVGGAVLVAAVVAGVWLLIGRRREIAQRPAVEALQAQIDTAWKAHALEQRRAQALGQGPTPTPVRATAQRLDRLESGDA